MYTEEDIKKIMDGTFDLTTDENIYKLLDMSYVALAKTLMEKDNWLPDIKNIFDAIPENNENANALHYNLLVIACTLAKDFMVTSYQLSEQLKKAYDKQAVEFMDKMRLSFPKNES